MQRVSQVSLLIACALVGLSTLGLARDVGQASTLPAIADSLSVTRHGDTVAVHAQGSNLFDIAEAVRKATGMRIDGMDVLGRDKQAGGIHFEAIEPISVLGVLAYEANSLLRCQSSTHCRFDSAGSIARLEALQSRWSASQDSKDAKAEADALDALLDYLRPGSDQMIAHALYVWTDAAQRARDRKDSKQETSLLNEYAGLVERSGLPVNESHSTALVRLGELDVLRGDPTAGRKQFEIAIRHAEKSNAPEQVELARLRLQVAGIYELNLDDLDTARRLYRKVADTYPAPDPSSEEAQCLAEALNGLTSVQIQDRQWDDAIALGERNLALRRARNTAMDSNQGIGVEAHLLGLALLSREDRLNEAHALLAEASQGSGSLGSSAGTFLSALQALGPFASDRGVQAELDGLRDRIFAVEPSTANFALAAMLESKAHSQYKAEPETTAWRTSCAASGIVVAAGVGARTREGFEKRETEKCLLRVTQSGAPQGNE